jgi:hypothetical protein
MKLDTDAEKIAALLAACQAYHQALDQCFAKLCALDHGFFPTQSVMWPAAQNGADLIRALGGRLALDNLRRSPGGH